MYFTPEKIKLVGRRFYQSLTSKGWFIPSSVELNDDYFSDFASLSVDKGIFYRKIPKEITPHIFEQIENLVANPFLTILTNLPVQKIFTGFALANIA